MNTRKYAANVISNLYLEGDVDFVFFGEIYSVVGEKPIIDELGYTGFDDSFNKTPLQRKNDTLCLAKYLVVERGDFIACEYNMPVPQGTFEEFCEVIEATFRQSKLDQPYYESDMRMGLHKIQKGKPAPTESEIPDEIVALFQPALNKMPFKRNDI